MSRKLFGRQPVRALPTFTRHTINDSDLIPDALSAPWLRHDLTLAAWAGTTGSRLGSVRFSVLERWRAESITMADLSDRIADEAKRKLRKELCWWG